jgi:hypothetical protein
MFIGIDKEMNLVYEGSASLGHALWPAPFLIPATIVPSSEHVLTPPRFENLFSVPLIFREDAFDPVSRIRRGRFYGKSESQPMEWQVYPHPAMATEIGKSNSVTGTLRKSLFTFSSYPLTNAFRELGNQQLLVVLGSDVGFTIWSGIGIEKTVTGDELVSLKARQGIGALPKLKRGAIPEAGQEKVVVAIEKLTEDIYRAGPESVIDRAREAVTAILGAYLQDHGTATPGRDLHELIKKLGNDTKIVAASAANIVRLFHGRGKIAVQEKLQVRPLREQDAELAVQCVGTILCELGWADWL